MKRIISVLLCAVLAFTFSLTPAKAAITVKTAEYLTNTVKNPTVASIGGEWTIIGLKRSNLNIPESYFDIYYTNVKSFVKEKKGVLHQRKNTEYSRVVIALTAIEKNPEDVEGYNLVKPLLDYSKTTSQGINGALWALIALDCGNYGNAEVRNKYVDYILCREIKNGGWALDAYSNKAEADTTAMVLTALSRYTYRQDVKRAVDSGITVLSWLQNSNGSYSSNGEETSESTAQVLVAISSLGIPYSDPRFVKNGNDLISALSRYQKKDGSFSHISNSDLMATEQCFYALVASDRFSQNKTALFDMSDILFTGLSGKSSAVNVQKVIYPGKSFADITSSKYKNAIEALSARGIINGINGNEFCPDKTMTRAEFSTIIVKALGLSLQGKNVFTDVTSESWYINYVTIANKFGIVNGISETKFNPEGKITVEQACLMVERAGKLCGLSKTMSQSQINSAISKYSDGKNVSAWAKSGVAYCLNKGLLFPSGSKINPQKPITRGEVAYILYNLLKGAKLV